MEKELKGSGIGVKNLGIPSSGRRPQWGPLFAFLPLIHCLVCVVVLFLVFFRKRDEFADSGRVSRSLCAFAKNKRKLHPDGQTLTQLATSVHSLVERMPSYASFYTRSVEPFNMHLCFFKFLCKSQVTFYSFKHSGILMPNVLIRCERFRSFLTDMFWEGSVASLFGLFFG